MLIKYLIPYCALIALCLPSVSDGAPPEGFTKEVLDGDYSGVLGIVPLGDGRSYAYQRNGIIWVLGSDGEASEQAVLDISEEVLADGDHGLMSVVLDPEFVLNGYIYLAYVVDAHHLFTFGTPDYSPNVTWEGRATIGRIVRYQAQQQEDFSVCDPSSRVVIIGESIQDGIPVVNNHHGLGSLRFSTDGSLMFPMGDSSAFDTADTGGLVTDGWIPDALKNGILREVEDIGAFRSQMIDSHSGKMHRVDRETGEGLPSNPYYDPKNPRSAQSRMWARGIRNVLRWDFLPGTSSTNPDDAQPGTIIVSDIGAYDREELSMISEPGVNLGWPLYEGYEVRSDYWFSDVYIPNVENPLGSTSCSSQILFRDALKQDRAGGPIFANPCDTPWVEADLSSFEGLTLNRDVGGATGTGSMVFDEPGSGWLDFEFNHAKDMGSTGDFAIRYDLSGSTVRSLDLTLDGEFIESIDIVPSPCQDCWSRAEFTLELGEGDHILRISGENTFGIRIDRLDIDGGDYTPLVNAQNVAVHQRPLIDWFHSTNRARAGVLKNGLPAVSNLGDDDCPIEADAGFRGVCIAGTQYIDDPRWPEEFHGLYFSDIYLQWIRILQFDENQNPIKVVDFDLTAGRISDLAFDEGTGELLAISWDRDPIRYTPPVVEPDCSADLNQDQLVDGQDLGLFLIKFGTKNSECDFNDDGFVDGGDLGVMLIQWGACK